MARVLDMIAGWIDRVFDPQMQKRTGALLILLSLPLYPVAFLVEEPKLVYWMSAAAISLTGWSIVVGAQALAEIVEDTSSMTSTASRGRSRTLASQGDEPGPEAPGHTLWRGANDRLVG